MSQKTYLVKVTDQAQKQMREIIQYIASELKSPDTALRLLDTMEEALPQRIALTKEEPWHGYGIRKMPVNNFYVYFWVDEDNVKVQITAVVYCKRDQKRQLSQMDMNE